MAEKWNWDKANPSKYHSASTAQATDFPSRCDYYRDEDTWERVYYPIRFQASAEQVKAAYDALSGKGAVTNFNQRVWNDLVDKIVEIKISDGQPRDRTWASTITGQEAWTVDEREFAQYNFLSVKHWNSPYISSATQLYIDSDDHVNYGPRLRADKFNILVNSFKSLPVTWEWEWEKDGVKIKPGTKAMGKYILDLVRAINHYQAQERLPFTFSLPIDDKLKIEFNRLQMDKSIILKPRMLSEDLYIEPNIRLSDSILMTIISEITGLNTVQNCTMTDWVGLGMDWNTRFLFNAPYNTIPVGTTKSLVIKVVSPLDNFEVVLHSMGYVPSIPMNMPINLVWNGQVNNISIVPSSVISGLRYNYNTNIIIEDCDIVRSHIIVPYSDSFLWNFTQDIDKLSLRDSCIIKVDNRMDSLYNVDVHQIDYCESLKFVGSNYSTLNSISRIGKCTTAHMASDLLFHLSTIGSISDQDYATMASKAKLYYLTDYANLDKSATLQFRSDTALSSVIGLGMPSKDETVQFASDDTEIALNVLSNLVKDETLCLTTDTIDILTYCAKLHAQLFKYVEASDVETLLAEGYLTNASQKELEAYTLLLYSSVGSLMLDDGVHMDANSVLNNILSLASMIVSENLTLNSESVFAMRQVANLLSKESIPINGSVGISLLGAAILDNQLCREISAEKLYQFIASGVLSHFDSVEMRSVSAVVFMELSELNTDVVVNLDSIKVYNFVTYLNQLTAIKAESNLTSNMWIMLDTVSDAVVKHSITIEGATKLAYNVLASLNKSRYSELYAKYRHYLDSTSKLQCEKFIALIAQMIDALVSSAIFALGTPKGINVEYALNTINSFADLRLQDRIAITTNNVLQKFTSESVLDNSVGTHLTANGILELVPSADITVERSKSWRRPEWKIINGTRGLNIYQIHTTIRQRDFEDRLRIDSMWYGDLASRIATEYKSSGELTPSRFRAITSNDIINFTQVSKLYRPSRLWNMPYRHNYDKVINVYQFHKVTEFDNAVYLDMTLQPVSGNSELTITTLANADVPKERSITILPFMQISELTAMYQTHEVTDIEISTMPNKLKYAVGEVFEPEGMIVTATYDDGTSSIITDYAYSTEPLTAEDTEFVISFEYKGKVVSTNITLDIITSYYSVSNLGGSYGFYENSSGYYESNNKGHPNSYALCKIQFSTGTGYIYLDCINYAESSYGFGIISNIDQTLSSSSSVDGTYFFSFSGKQSSSVQTVAIPVPDSDEHFITVKYKKDGSVNTGNDSLQFKVRFE